jgi:NADH dehydrogenase
MRGDRAEVARHRLAGELGDRPSHLHAGRAPADHHESEQSLTPCLVRLGTPVTELDANGVSIGQGSQAERIEAGTVIWGAGVMASPAASWLDAEADRVGKVHVEPDLRVADTENVFAIGDTACCQGPHGRPLPGVAPVAKQQGKYVAATIIAALKGRKAPGAFRYRDYGNLATIGRRAAVIDFGRIRISGFPAWVLWSVAHIWFLVGFRSRIAVGLSWVWNYLTFARSARLITGEIR